MKVVLIMVYNTLTVYYVLLLSINKTFSYESSRDRRALLESGTHSVVKTSNIANDPDTQGWPRALRFYFTENSSAHTHTHTEPKSWGKWGITNYKKKQVERGRKKENGEDVGRRKLASGRYKDTRRGGNQDRVEHVCQAKEGGGPR